MKIVNEDWKAKKEEEIKNYFETHQIPKPVRTGFNKAAQWYILYLRERNIPFKVNNLGAGVKEIIIQPTRCEYCKGKGYL